MGITFLIKSDEVIKKRILNHLCHQIMVDHLIESSWCILQAQGHVLELIEFTPCLKGVILSPISLNHDLPITISHINFSEIFILSKFRKQCFLIGYRMSIPRVIGNRFFNVQAIKEIEIEYKLGG